MLLLLVNHLIFQLVLSVFFIAFVAEVSCVAAAFLAIVVAVAATVVACGFCYYCCCCCCCCSLVLFFFGCRHFVDARSSLVVRC